MTDWNWQNLGVQVGVPFASGMGGWLIGIWRWGRDSAKKEQAVKDDYDGKINSLREEVRTAMTAFAKDANNRNDALVDQFKESFDGIRRQMDEHRFYTEKDFMKKEDFRDFRDEYREDMRDLKASIATIAQRQ